MEILSLNGNKYFYVPLGIKPRFFCVSSLCDDNTKEPEDPAWRIKEPQGNVLLQVFVEGMKAS